MRIGVLLASMTVLFSFGVAAQELPECNDAMAAPLPDNIYTDPSVDMRFDGFFMGADGCLYDPQTVWIEQVIPVSAAPNVDVIAEQGEDIWFINGADSTLENTYAAMNALAQTTSLKVLGIYNADTGLINALQVNETLSAATVTFAVQAKRRLERGEIVHIMGSSHGTRLISDGLILLRDDLIQMYQGDLYAVSETLRLIRVESIGGVSSYYPPGPKYVHYANVFDVVPLAFGAANPLDWPGQGAVIAFFFDADARSLRRRYARKVQGCGNVACRYTNAFHNGMVYFEHRLPFDVARLLARDPVVPTYIWLGAEVL